jgi:hypothetical protein
MGRARLEVDDLLDGAERPRGPSDRESRGELEHAVREIFPPRDRVLERPEERRRPERLDVGVDERPLAVDGGRGIGRRVHEFELGHDVLD